MIQISGSVAATLVIAFIACVFAFGRILLSQFEKRMQERLHSIDNAQKRENARLSSLIEEVNTLSRLLPLEYVRREDWIRFSAAIDHKLDRLAELVLSIPGGNHRARG